MYEVPVSMTPHTNFNTAHDHDHAPAAISTSTFSQQEAVPVHTFGSYQELLDSFEQPNGQSSGSETTQSVIQSGEPHQGHDFKF